MSAPAAIRGCFSDFKLIRGRKVCQLVIEIPIEEADAALAAMGGVPSPASERWVAVALLDMKAVQQAPQADKERRPFPSLPYPQQAALRCQDADYRKFLNVRTADEAAEMIRQECCVVSRSELANDEKAKRAWLQMERSYEAYRGNH